MNSALHVLVIRLASKRIDIDLLRSQTGLQVVVNTLPTPEGIAVFDCGREVDWAWPATVIADAGCDIGRHRADIKVNEGEDFTGIILDVVHTLQEQVEGEEDVSDRP